MFDQDRFDCGCAQWQPQGYQFDVISNAPDWQYAGTPTLLVDVSVQDRVARVKMPRSQAGHASP